PSTCKPLELEDKSKRRVGVGARSFVRVSADGKTFGVWNPDVSPQGILTFSLLGKELKVHYAHDSAGHVIPGPDGRLIYTARGMYTNEVKAVGDTGAPGSYCLPAHQGDFYLTLQPRDPTTATGKGAVRVHLAGETRPLITLNDVILPRDINQWDRESFGTDRRVHFIPDAKLLVTIPDTKDKLVLHRFDLDAALDKAGIDYLFVTSRPPALAGKGIEYRYQIAVKSKKGGVKYKLDAAPKGMSVSSTGLVRWSVPKDCAEKKVDVIVSASDASGQEIFHSFKLDIVDK